MMLIDFVGSGQFLYADFSNIWIEFGGIGKFQANKKTKAEVRRSSAGFYTKENVKHKKKTKAEVRRSSAGFYTKPFSKILSLFMDILVGFCGI